jgi:class 3 adenylate cyclase
MSAVSRWLERAGFAEYVDAFESRNIDFELLISFTEGDLEKLGVPPEPRQAILCEIERLAHSSFASVEPGTPSRHAERRQLTLMFCDLVNSVGLSTRLDPEDLRDVIKSYQQTCLQPIHRYSGYVARYIGDGILVFLAIPQLMKTTRKGRSAQVSKSSFLSVS